MARPKVEGSIFALTWDPSLHEFTTHGFWLRGKNLDLLTQQYHKNLGFNLERVMPNALEPPSDEANERHWKRQWGRHDVQTGLTAEAYFRRVISTYDSTVGSDKSLGLEPMVTKKQTVGSVKRRLRSVLGVDPHIQVKPDETLKEVHIYRDTKDNLENTPKAGPDSKDGVKLGDAEDVRLRRLNRKRKRT